MKNAFALAQSLISLNVPAALTAQDLADKVKAGRSVVGVLAPFGTGVLATKLLDSEGPLPEELPRPQAQQPATEAAYGEGAPLSRALGMQVLSPNAAPFSDMFGWPTKSKKRHFLTSRLGSPHFALSSMFGMGLLSRNGAPLSSKFGLRTLSDNAAPLSSKFGWATASGEAAMIGTYQADCPMPIETTDDDGDPIMYGTEANGLAVDELPVGWWDDDAVEWEPDLDAEYVDPWVLDQADLDVAHENHVDPDETDEDGEAPRSFMII